MRGRHARRHVWERRRWTPRGARLARPRTRRPRFALAVVLVLVPRARRSLSLSTANVHPAHGPCSACTASHSESHRATASSFPRPTEARLHLLRRLESISAPPSLISPVVLARILGLGAAATHGGRTSKPEVAARRLATVRRPARCSVLGHVAPRLLLYHRSVVCCIHVSLAYGYIWQIYPSVPRCAYAARCFSSWYAFPHSAILGFPY